MRKISTCLGKAIQRHECQDDEDSSCYKNTLRGKGSYSQNTWKQFQKRNRTYIKEPNGNLRTEKFNAVYLIAEWRSQ